jgi:hypothetical protein
LEELIALTKLELKDLEKDQSAISKQFGEMEKGGFKSLFGLNPSYTLIDLLTMEQV